jgi:hypothetical protein
MVAVRRHHVFVLEGHLGGDLWQIYDAKFRRPADARSIGGWTIVNRRAELRRFIPAPRRRNIVRHGGVHLGSIVPFGLWQSADWAPNRDIDHAAIAG